MRDGPEVPLAHNVARSKWIALMMTILAVDNVMTPPMHYAIRAMGGVTLRQKKEKN